MPFSQNHQERPGFAVAARRQVRCGGWAPGTGLGQAGNLGHGSERRLTGDWAPSESRRFSASITMNLTEGRQAKLQLTKQQSLFGRERGVAVSVQSVTQRERPCDARERTCRAADPAVRAGAGRRRLLFFQKRRICICTLQIRFLFSN